MKKLNTMICLLMVALMCTACTNQASQEKNPVSTIDNTTTTTYPLTITDQYGEKITIAKEPQKVISFSPELVEIMYALGVGDKLIGRSVYCDYPEAAKEIPDMGDMINLNVEKIVDSNPDLVLLSSLVEKEIVSTLQAQGITVLILNADATENGVYDYFTTMGSIFNKSQEAYALVNDMKTQIADIQDKIKDLEKPTAYFVVGFGEFDSTATGDTFISQLMEMAGSSNVAKSGTNWMYSIEALMEQDPDILICSNLYDAKAQIINAEGYKALTAVKEGRLYEVDENIFYRQGPRMVEAVRILAQLFHPEAFSTK